MVYNRFSIIVILLTLLISVSGSLFLWSLSQDYLAVAKFSTGAIWIILILVLLSFLNKTNRSLSNFLQTVKSLDSSKQLIGKGTNSFKLLNLSYNEIIDSIQHVKIEKEEDYRYYQSMTDNAGSGIISFRENGEIDHINHAVREIFKLDSVGTIEGLDKYAEGFSEFCHTIKPGNTELYRTIIDGEIKSLATRKSILNKGNNTISLVSVQNIHGILEEKEIQVWQKLINVLTHEIMNSVSPIKSLSGTLSRKLRLNKALKQQEDIELLEGLEAIDKRSKGLMKFVESYQELTKIPDPVFEETKVLPLIKELSNLLSADLSEKKITMEIDVDPDLEYKMDEKLISQTIINLIKNSVSALEKCNNKCIRIIAQETPNSRLQIKVIDNGKGIEPDIIENIFIPFYTTREGGSGIGLSLAKQIMSMHNGSISVKSIPKVKTVFILSFN